MKCIHSPSPTLLVGSSGFESLSDVLHLYTSYKRRLCSLHRPLFLVGSSGFEPPTLRLSGARSNHLSYEPVSLYVGGDEGIRTLDPLLAGQVLSQLSYTPVMGPLPCAGSRGPSKLNNKSGLFRSRRFPWVFFSAKTSSAPLGAPLALFQASLFSIERR